jgi:hypothetical protein
MNDVGEVKWVGRLMPRPDEAIDRPHHILSPQTQRHEAKWQILREGLERDQCLHEFLRCASQGHIARAWKRSQDAGVWEYRLEAKGQKDDCRGKGCVYIFEYYVSSTSSTIISIIILWNAWCGKYSMAPPPGPMRPCDGGRSQWKTTFHETLRFEGLYNCGVGHARVFAQVI